MQTNFFTSFSIKRVFLGLAFVIGVGYFTIFGFPFSKVKSINVIHIVPVGNSATGSVEQLQQILNEEFPSITTSIEETMNIPQGAFDVERNQYNAVILLQELNKLPYTQSENIIGITPFALFTPDLNFVFSSTKKKVGIFTTLYLQYKVQGEQMVFDPNIDGNLVQERIQKTVMRMVGAMAGIRPRLFGDYKCVMRFSNSLEDLDAKGTEWCGNEREKVLKAQGL
ncbi:MAG: hypothetical protein HYT37_01280 [Candidatus Sungbacteria bacterium]|nr:hypothetical protein [Candidatus Sungbacteria bacterium]